MELDAGIVQAVTQVQIMAAAAAAMGGKQEEPGCLCCGRQIASFDPPALHRFGDQAFDRCDRQVARGVVISRRKDFRRVIRT
ncbi:hypothetical protein [Pararhizobium antarcticum]|uniref:Uncharacterized protein n=1 Tax=Pararhizobium antarcticum TaxID=1798805 RepID=A0A657LN82_9HYPH|nr:hypothetical protein [Pararhizobium antarcticum]OJF92565.1 hypothetical protein AX760_22440 [Pararhizobium antarcticum]OJF95832.1 hypothetical protein AX761_16985 [Rhizobium sp. 58]